jgi:exoribonuclease R
VSARLERATVRSRAALDYPSVQASLDRGDADDALLLLREIGMLRRDLEAKRGGVSLDLPSQEVVPIGDGSYRLEYDAPLLVEGWNAQISLLAGLEAAKIMIDARAGIVRTLPAPQPGSLERLQHTARALGVSWPSGAKWSDVVRALDRAEPDDDAFLIQAAHVLRGAGYAKLDASNTASNNDVPIHAGVAAPYAHVTAPLRRLADRYANEIVVAHCAGAGPPEWTLAALDELVTTMEHATHRDAAVERAVIDAVECAVLQDKIGCTFEGVVVDGNERGVIVQLREPAVVAPLEARVPLGDTIEVELVAVDLVARRVRLAMMSGL